VRLPEWATEIGSKSLFMSGAHLRSNSRCEWSEFRRKMVVNFNFGIFGPWGYRVRGFWGGMREAMPPGARQGEGGCSIYIMKAGCIALGAHMIK
jgi:hypothetical protein